MEGYLPSMAIYHVTHWAGHLINPKAKHRGFLYAIRVYSFVGLTSLTTLATILALDSNSNWDRRVGSLQMIVSGFHMWCKYVNMTLRKEKVIKLIEEIDNLWIEAKTYWGDEKRLKTSIINNKISIYFGLVIFGGFIVMSIVMYIVKKHLNLEGSDELIITIWMPKTNFKKTEFVIVLMITMCGAINGSCIIGTISSIVNPICFQVETICHVFENEFKTFKEKDIKKFFNFHQKCRRLLIEFNNIFSFQYTLEMSISSIQIAARVYYTQNMIQTKDPLAAADVFLCFMAIFVPYVICYNGNKIKELEIELRRSIYRTNWFQRDVKLRKELLIVMTILEKPYGIQDKSVFHFSNPEYLTLVNASYSFITLLFRKS